MKKLFLVFCVLIFSCNLALAEYKPIPKNLSKQYQKEVITAINNEYPITKKGIALIAKTAHEKYKKVLKNKNLYMDYAISNYDTYIYTPIFDLLSDLISITGNYVEINNEELATDYDEVLYNYLIPYFNDNNIDPHKIDNLYFYANAKQEIIEKENSEIYRLVYSEDNSANNNVKTFQEFVENQIHNDVSYIDIFDTKYTCLHSECYNLDSFKYDRQSKTYSIDMILDLMHWDRHQTYKSPYNDGDVSYLIFNTKINDKKFTVECKSYVAANLVPYYHEGSMSARYDIKAIHNGKPKTIKEIRSFEKEFATGINKDIYSELIKILANN